MEQVVQKEGDRRTEQGKVEKERVHEKRAQQTNHFVVAEHLMKNVLEAGPQVKKAAVVQHCWYPDEHLTLILG